MRHVFTSITSKACPTHKIFRVFVQAHFINYFYIKNRWIWSAVHLVWSLPLLSNMLYKWGKQNLTFRESNQITLHDWLLRAVWVSDVVSRCTLGLQLCAGITAERTNTPQAFSLSAITLFDSLSGGEKQYKPLRQALINCCNLCRPWFSVEQKKCDQSFLGPPFPALPKFL